MKGYLKKVLCLALSAIFLLTPVANPVATQAAQATVYQLTSLLSSNKIKALGRTQAGGSGLLADWSGAGFEINVSGTGGTMSVGYKSSYAAYWAIFVDGAQTARILAPAATAGSSFSFTVPSGAHTIGVVKDTEISTSEAAYYDLTTLSFAGQINTAPAKKDLYIEFIGDSYSCGDGAAGAYEPGAQAWVAVNHAATKGFPWYTAKTLNADYSIVARGGIGLFVGISEQEGTANKKGMQDIYKYTSGYRASAGLYDFTRQPDIVVVELGANDGISATDSFKTIEYWTSLLEGFTDQIRTKNPNAAIVYLSHNAVKHQAMLSIVNARKATDPNMYAFFFAHNGNGSAALATQYDGHPDADDQKDLSDALVSFMRYSDILPSQNVAPTYKNIPYYVSQNGSDSNSGTSLSAAKATVQAAVNQAIADNASFANNARLVIYVQGTVSAGSTELACGNLVTANGAKLPVLITTYNYTGTKAVVDTGHAPASDSDAAIVFGSNVTLQNITLQATTGASGYRDHYLYAGYNEVTLDNVTFALAGATPTNNTGWIVSAGHPTGANAPTAETTSSVTFRNGNYTNLARAAAVNTNASVLSGLPKLNCKVIVEDGAALSTLYCRCGTTPVKSATADIRGGTINKYVGTGSGTSATSRLTYSGDVNLVMSGGTVYGTSFATTGKFATLTGNINTTISGGSIYVTPQTSSQYESYLFGGGQNAKVKNVNTTISGGIFYLVTNVASADSGYYFGPSGSGSAENVTNTISGGSFLPMAGTAATGHVSVYFGPHTGSITGTLRNEISGGAVSFDAASAQGSVVFGSRGVNWPIGKMVNILGKEGALQGPRFLRAIVNLGGTWAQVGCTSAATSEPAATACKDDVVISNTIYGGYFSSTVYGGPVTPTDTSKSRYSFVHGSIENKVYSGHFIGSFIAGGKTNVFGHVTTDIYGGIFTNIYGDNLSATIYDGVTLNLHGFTEYAPVKSDNTWKIFAGGTSKIKVQTPGRDAFTLNLGGPNADTDSATTPIAPTMPLVTNTGNISGTKRLVLGNTILKALPSGFNETDILLAKNDTLSIQTGDALTVNNVSGNGSILFGSGTSLNVTDSASGQLNCTLASAVANEFAYITAPANTADNTFTFTAASGIRPVASNGKQWSTGEIAYDHVSISTPKGSKGYDTLAAAIAAYTGEENTYIVLWENATQTVTVDKPIYLDLNGHNASIKLTGAGAVYGMDTSGNQFTEPTGTLTLSGGSAKPATQISDGNELFHYVALGSNGQFKFHRFGLDTKLGLRPYNAQYGIGLYFQPNYQADATLMAAIRNDNVGLFDYGVSITMDKDGTPKVIEQSLLDYTGLTAGSKNDSLRVLIYDLIPTNRQVTTRQAQTGEDCTGMDVDAFLATYDLSAYDITAKTYLKVGGVYLMDDAQATISLQEAVKKVDKLYPNMAQGSAQRTALDTMWKNYSIAMGAWFSDDQGALDNGLINLGSIKVDVSDWFN